jgi:uncharacterized protein
MLLCMAKREKERRTLAEVLESTSDVLFPQDVGEAKVEIDSRDASGDTPLHVMAWRKDRHGVKLLIEAGADVNAIGDMSEAPLHIAVRAEDLENVETLLRAGAKTDIRSEFDETPLEAAQKRGSKAMQRSSHSSLGNRNSVLSSSRRRGPRVAGRSASPGSPLARG